MCNRQKLGRNPLGALALGLAVSTLPAFHPAGEASEPVPVYRTRMVDRTIQAMNFRNPGSENRVDLRPTALLAGASGEARVERDHGALRIDARIEGLGSPAKLGPGYLTWVMWTITPEGRPGNLGELVPKDGKARLEASTELQAFGIIVTAEPYFAVSTPGEMVVLEAVARPDTRGRVEAVEARLELLGRDAYAVEPAPSAAILLGQDGESRHLAQARQAVAIARFAGAPRHAGDAFAKAERLLAEASAARSSKTAVMLARQTVQTAEDARAIAVKRSEEAAIAGELALAAARTAGARDEAERARDQALQAQSAALDARTLADDERARADRAEQLAASEAAARAAAEQQAERAVSEASELRGVLLEQLSRIIETRETARGLMVNVPDVFFATGRAELAAGAREKLARLAGVLLPYPQLRIEVEGHADSVGSHEFNQQLSEDRARSVLGYLAGQGIAPAQLSAEGFGETRPVADNDSPAGRQLNRRVELIISGEILGQRLSALSGQRLP